MRYFYTAIEQLDLAARQLHASQPSTARVALILTDNIVELMLHQQCLDAARRDRLYGHLDESRLDPRRRNEILGRHFALKLSFCRTHLKRLTADEFNTIRVAHDLRNELYHIGLRHEGIVTSVAWHYHDLACTLLARLPLDTYYWRADDQPSEVVVQHATPKPWELKDPFGVAAVSLARARPRKAPALAPTLAKSLNSRLDEVEGHFGIIVESDERSAIVEAEFDEFVYGENSQVWDKIRGKTGIERERIIASVRKTWRPRYRTNPIAGWRRRYTALAQVKSVGDALARFSQLECELAPFEKFVINAATAVINAIESAVEIRRGK